MLDEVFAVINFPGPDIAWEIPLRAFANMAVDHTYDALAGE